MNDTELSWWDRIKIAVMPISHAEATVDAIYGPEGRGLIPIPPDYEPDYAASPAQLVEARQEFTEAVARPFRAIAEAGKTSLFMIGVIAFVAVAALVAINAFIRR